MDKKDGRKPVPSLNTLLAGHPHPPSLTERVPTNRPDRGKVGRLVTRPVRTARTGTEARIRPLQEETEETEAEAGTGQAACLEKVTPQCAVLAGGMFPGART